MTELSTAPAETQGSDPNALDLSDASFVIFTQDAWYDRADQEAPEIESLLDLTHLSLFARFDDGTEFPLYVCDPQGTWLSQSVDLAENVAGHKATPEFIEAVAQLPEPDPAWMALDEEFAYEMFDRELYLITQLRNAVRSGRAPPEAAALIETCRDRQGLNTNAPLSPPTGN